MISSRKGDTNPSNQDKGVCVCVCVCVCVFPYQIQDF